MIKHLIWLLGHQHKSALPAIFDELKIMPLEHLRKLSMLKLWGKIIRLPEDNMLKILFRQDKDLGTAGYWAQHVRPILTNLGLQEHWNNLTLPVKETDEDPDTPTITTEAEKRKAWSLLANKLYLQ